MKLPAETIPIKELIKKEAKTNTKYGINPDKRPIEELLSYGIVKTLSCQRPAPHL
tara:strand:- start:162 stop:326 length:165 start_codon:yes stop_codon:yes gene_type:complete